jgi:hypothetical protein
MKKIQGQALRINLSKEASKNLKKVKQISKTTYLGSTKIFQSKSKMKIYAVTSVSERKQFMWALKRKPTKAEIKISDRAAEPRCWGWVPTLREAQDAVKSNAGDMAECCYYTHVVIEELGPSIPCIPSVDRTWWYEWHVDPKDPNKFRGQWLKCPQPVWAKNICNWAL